MRDVILVFTNLKSNGFEKNLLCVEMSWIIHEKHIFSSINIAQLEWSVNNFCWTQRNWFLNHLPKISSLKPVQSHFSFDNIDRTLGNLLVYHANLFAMKLCFLLRWELKTVNFRGAREICSALLSTSIDDLLDVNTISVLLKICRSSTVSCFVQFWNSPFGFSYWTDFIYWYIQKLDKKNGYWGRDDKIYSTHRRQFIVIRIHHQRFNNCRERKQ